MGAGCPKGADVPDVAALLATLPGCDALGTRLKYMDGHVHCNHAGGRAEDGSEAAGFMIGGHGMSGCAQYGFSLVDSTGGRLKVLYFEERSVKADDFEAILSCVTANGVSGCGHLASVWLERPPTTTD